MAACSPSRAQPDYTDCPAAPLPMPAALSAAAVQRHWDGLGRGVMGRGEGRSGDARRRGSRSCRGARCWQHETFHGGKGSRKLIRVATRGLPTLTLSYRTRQHTAARAGTQPACVLAVDASTAPRMPMAQAPDAHIRTAATLGDRRACHIPSMLDALRPHSLPAIQCMAPQRDGC